MSSRLDELFAPYEGKRHLSVKELGEVLGVSEQTARRWLSLGVVPGYQIGHTWMILRDEVHDWMLEQHNQGKD